MSQHKDLVFPIESLVRRAFRRFGLDLTRYRVERTEGGRLAQMLASHGVDLVFDVGANIGQFATGLREGGYRGHIVSFEPLSSAHARLLDSSRRDSAWTIAPRMALGATPGEIELMIAGNSVSSSVLPMLNLHVRAAPDSRYVGREITPLSTLDREAPHYLGPDSRCYVKIDTQGYEAEVLAGASVTLKKAAGVQLELSLAPLYEGQADAAGMLARLQELGFEPWAQWPALFDPTHGRMLQMDTVLFRR